MYSKTVFLSCFLISMVFAQGNHREDSVVTYHWRNNLTIEVPEGFSVKNWEYGEGIETYLVYPDSSIIFLHFGFNMRVPRLGSDEYLVYQSKNYEDKIERSGRIKNTRLFWREFNFKGKPINIGYHLVRNSRLNAFDKALASFSIATKLAD